MFVPKPVSYIYHIMVRLLLSGPPATADCPPLIQPVNRVIGSSTSCRLPIMPWMMTKVRVFFISGRVIRKKVVTIPAPSILAAS